MATQPVIVDELVIDLWPTVGRVLADNLYLVLGTADAAGKPWVSPVFFAARDVNLLCWVSSPDSRHSRNIDVQPTVAITVFDSRAAIGVGEAVYMTGTARVLGASAGAGGLDMLNAGLPVGRQLTGDDLGSRGPLAVDEAAVDDHYVLVRGGDPRLDNDVDTALSSHPDVRARNVKRFGRSHLGLGRPRRRTRLRAHAPPSRPPGTGPRLLCHRSRIGRCAGAKDAAGDRDVMVHGGSAAQSFLRAGLVDELATTNTLLLVADIAEGDIVGDLLGSSHLTFLANGPVARVDQVMVNQARPERPEQPLFLLASSSHSTTRTADRDQPLPAWLVAASGPSPRVLLAVDSAA